MERSMENISKLEQHAEELVSDLQQLSSEIGSYRDAAKALGSAEQSIGGLCDEVKGMIAKTAELIGTFNEINGPGIITMIDSVQSDLQESHAKLAVLHKKINTNRLLLLLVGIVILAFEAYPYLQRILSQ